MDFSELFSRRQVLKGGISLAGIGFILATGGCETLIEAIKNRPVRRRIGSTGSASDLAIYDDAVARMKALPTTDPRNWVRQAEIHQNFCPHGNWYFLPWHRAYLFYFERICRELTGEADFGLPYWNWQVNRSIPADFWSGSLDDNTRSIDSSDQASTSYIGQSVIQDILGLTNFEQFASYASTALRGGTGGGYGSLEATPHNNIHGFVGGNMGGFMSPLDPIFWGHHNMVDCLWEVWNNKLGNLNTSDTSWTNFNLAGMFVDGDGSPAEMTCGLTTILPLISYRFAASTKGDDLVLDNFIFSQEALQAGGNIRHAVQKKLRLTGALTINAHSSLTPKIEKTAQLERSVNQRILAQLSGVQVPVDDNGYVRVFVNLPGANADTSIENPHYAGSIGFFTNPGMKMKMPDTYYVDISDTLDRLRTSDKISLTLVHVPHDTRHRELSSVHVNEINLILTPSAIKGK